MAQGKSFFAFGALIDVHVDTLYEWCKKHKEFSDAKKMGEAKALAYWEDAVQASRDKTGAKPAMYLFTMRCRFGRYGYNPDSALNSFSGDGEDDFEFDYGDKDEEKN
jgi:hypothetical protein